MKGRIKYEELEQHFIAPISFPPMFSNIKRIPRKLKKEIKRDYPLVWNSDSLELGQKLWYRLNHVNQDYVRFLIKKITNDYTKYLG